MIKNILASAAAAGLLIAPIAAQANTRASDSQVSLAALGDTARVGSINGGAESLKGSAGILLLLFGGLAAAIILLVESGEDDASPGTGG